MFADISQNSSKRLVEVRELLDFIKTMSPAPPIPETPTILIAKGLFFVLLYGAYEFTVKSIVNKSIEVINSECVPLNDCKPLLFSIALNSELDAIASMTGKKWEKRKSLFDNFIKNPTIFINAELFPTNGRNLTDKQLLTIWNSFAIEDPILPRNELIGRIKELILNRNAIAHGTSSAIEIGSLNTISELYKKYSDISEVCSYVIQVFEDYLKRRKYLK
jgi:hypothetical protein